MMFLKKLSIALSIAAFSAMALSPALAAAQYITGSGGSVTGSGGSVTGSNGSFIGSNGSFTGSNSSVTSSNNAGDTVGGLKNPLGNVTGVCQLMKIVLNVLILIGVPIAMFFIVLAGFKLILARGNPTALTAARTNLRWTFIGIAIFIGVWFIVGLLANTLGALGVSILGDCR